MAISNPAIGVILPSSNRIVERVTKTILADFPGVDACFSRVPYDGHPGDGYDLQPFRHAAEMLAQAKPAVIVWNATRGAKLGFEPDRRLCAMIETETGIPATTTALATLELLLSKGFRRIGLLQQGDDEEGALLTERFAEAGISVIASRSLGITDNFQASIVASEKLVKLATELAGSDPDAILIWSTNLAGHELTPTLGETLGLPVLDSTAIGTWAALDHLRHNNRHFERPRNANAG